MPSASDIGKYVILIEGETISENHEELEPSTASSSFTIEVISEQTEIAEKCADDEITTDFTVESIRYEIGVSAEVLIEPTW